MLAVIAGGRLVLAGGGATYEFVDWKRGSVTFFNATLRELS